MCSPLISPYSILEVIRAAAAKGGHHPYIYEVLHLGELRLDVKLERISKDRATPLGRRYPE